MAQRIPLPGKGVPPGITGGQDFRDYSPGELKQWQAYKEYTESHEEVDDIVRALRGGKSRPEAAGGPLVSGEAQSLAWQLEMMDADQEAELAKVDQEETGLAEILTPDSWDAPESFAGAADVKEVLDPETARRRYLLWRKEMGAFGGAETAPLLLGRTSQGIFTSLRKEGGTGRVVAR